MDTTHLMFLAGLQGLTEFLPVSSSGHLILFSKFTTFPDQGLAMDVAVHIGSILAVVIYFWRAFWDMLKGLFKNHLLPNFQDEGSRLFYLIVIGSIPAAVAGYLMYRHGMEWVRETKLVGWTLVGYGILLYFADKIGMTIRRIEHLGVLDAFLIGCAQALALIPGTSRSGITITMGRLLGLERREAAKFSMILSVPIIAMAGAATLLELSQGGNWAEMAAAYDAMLYSFMASILAIYIIMWWLKKSTFLPFVIYRIALGAILLLDSYKIININELF